jgi:hypothetical protein
VKEKTSRMGYPDYLEVMEAMLRKSSTLMHVLDQRPLKKMSSKILRCCCRVHLMATMSVYSPTVRQEVVRHSQSRGLSQTQE